MKNKKALILALSTGLIASGGLVPVYAAETPENPPTSPTEKVGEEIEEPTDNPTSDPTGEDDTTGSEGEGSTSDEDSKEGESADIEAELVINEKNDENIKVSNEKSDSDLEFKDSWKIPFVEKKPDQYEVIGKREGEGIDFDSLYGKYENEKEFQDKLVIATTKNLKNNLDKVQGDKKAEFEELIRAFEKNGATEENINKALELSKENNAEYNKRELIDYIKTEYSVDNDVEIEYDDEKEYGEVEVVREAEQGHKKSVVTEGSPSSIFKIGDFLTSEEIRELRESGNDLNFNQIGEETLLNNLTDEQIEKIFKNKEIKPKYKYVDAINPDTGEKDAKHATAEDVIKQEEFEKKAIPPKVIIGNKAAESFEDLYTDDSKSNWALIDDSSNENKKQAVLDGNPVLVEENTEPNTSEINGLEFLNNEELQKKIEEEIAKENLEDARAIAIAELGNKPNLTPEQRADAISNVANAENIDEVKDILNDTETLANENAEQEAKNDLEDAKAIAIAELGNKPNLTPEQRADAISNVAKAENIDEVKDILNDTETLANENAEQEAKNDLEDAKAIAIAELGNKPNLTPEQRADAISNVVKAENIEEVNDILNDSENLADENARKDQEKEAEAEEAKNNLEDTKAIAIAELGNKQDLTPEQIVVAISDVAKADSIDKVNEVLKNVEELAKENKKSKEEQTPDPNKDTPTENTETPITKDYKRDLQEEINKLPHLSQEEKNEAIVDIQATNTLETALPIYNKAIDLNSRRSDDLSELRRDYQEKLDRLKRLLDREREDYAKRMRDKDSEKAIRDIYLEAIVRDNMRSLYPTVPTSSTPTVNTTATNVNVKNKDIIYVGKGYIFVAEGFHSVSKLTQIRADLQAALEKNRVMVRAVNFLIENTPHTISKVRPILDRQLSTAQRLQDQCRMALAELDAILSYAYNTNMYVAR